MHNVTKISEGFYYIGGSDRRLELFENVYPIPNGASYNSFLYLDEKTCVLDTVDSSVSELFFENVEFLLNGRPLDYLIVDHMEPDHAANIGNLCLRHPETTVVVNAMSKKFLMNFFPNLKNNLLVVKEGDKLSIGKHTFTFVMAPMVHWPEVMFTYEMTEKVLFSADAFGTFGALSGHIFADSSNFDRLYLDEARRYYTNIVGKYGDQVLAVLKKAANIEIKTICPLHGPIYRGNLNYIINPYMAWASYTPEDKNAVMVAYSSVYGGTANCAEIIATKLAEKGVKNIVVYDVSKTDASYLIAESFRVGTIVLAATTYNAGVFVKMEDFLHDLANHKIRNRTFAFVENGSWAPASRAGMKKILEGLQDCKYIDETLTISSTLKEGQLGDIDKLVEAIVESMGQGKKAEAASPLIDNTAMFKLTYGLFALFSKDKNGRDDASINNSFFQVSDSPNLVMLSVNKANYSAQAIKETGIFTVSCLTEDTDYELIKRFGFQSGRDVDKMVGIENILARTSNGLYSLTEMSNSFISCKVKDTIDCGNHVLFIAEITEAKNISSAASLTYAYYFAHIKPKPLPSANNGGKKKIGWRCRICGYTYVGDTLPADFICPLCKHPASDFEKVEL